MAAQRADNSSTTVRFCHWLPTLRLLGPEFAFTRRNCAERNRGEVPLREITRRGDGPIPVGVLGSIPMISLQMK